MPDEQSKLWAPAGLNSEQKTGFVLLLVFAVIGLSLGALQIRNTLLAPFALNSTIPAEVKDQVNSVDALKLRDTDHDGLNDYDELYVYGTSPYLYDTFGYEMSDKDVIAKNLPLCPGAGKNCDDTAMLASSSSTISNPGLEEAPPDLSKLIESPSQIRKLLLQSGVTQEMLDKISDDDLMTMVEQTMTSSTFVSSTSNL